MKLNDQQRKALIDACARQQTLRIRACVVDVDYPYSYLDLNLRALNLADIGALRYVNNGLLTDSPITLISAIQLFWRVCDKHSNKPKEQAKFAKNLTQKFDAKTIISESIRYIDDMMLDSDNFTPDEDADLIASNNKPPHYNFITSTVSELASAYHWSESDILNMPMPRLWQYLHLARECQNPQYKWKQYSQFISDKILRGKI